MSIYRHYVAGFFSHRSQAEKIFSQVLNEGFSYKYVRIFDKYSVLPVLEKQSDKDAVKNIFSRSSAESLVGTGLSSLLDIKLIAKEVTLIIEDALIPQLVTLGWGTSMRVIDTNFYTRDEVRILSDLVHDAVLSRQIVITVETSSPEETARVSELMQAVMGHMSDVS